MRSSLDKQNGTRRENEWKAVNRETADEGRDRAVIRIRGSWDLSKKAGHG